MQTKIIKLPEADAGGSRIGGYNEFNVGQKHKYKNKIKSTLLEQDGLLNEELLLDFKMDTEMKRSMFQSILNKKIANCNKGTRIIIKEYFNNPDKFTDQQHEMAILEYFKLFTKKINPNDYDLDIYPVEAIYKDRISYARTKIKEFMKICQLKF